jgi:hypothetical protein
MSSSLPVAVGVVANLVVEAEPVDIAPLTSLVLPMALLTL